MEVTSDILVENLKLKDYIFIHGQVIHVTPNRRTMTPLRLFKKKKLLAEMHHKTFGSNSKIPLLHLIC